MKKQYNVQLKSSDWLVLKQADPQLHSLVTTTTCKSKKHCESIVAQIFECCPEIFEANVYERYVR